MVKWIYCMFVLEYKVKDSYGSSTITHKYKEECFASKHEMKRFIKINYKSCKNFERIEKYKGSKENDIKYVYRVVFR